MLTENQVLKKAISKANYEIKEVTLDGEYDIQKSQLTNQMREVKSEWRETYYQKIEKQKKCIQMHSEVVDHSRKVRKMQEMIVEYKNLNNQQRKEVGVEEGDFVIEQEKISQMEQGVQKANIRREEEAKHFEGNNKAHILRNCSPTSQSCAR